MKLGYTRIQNALRIVGKWIVSTWKNCSNSPIHKAAGSLVTGRSLQNGKMSMGNHRTERPPEPILYGGRPSGDFVNRAVSCLIFAMETSLMVHPLTSAIYSTIAGTFTIAWTISYVHTCFVTGCSGGGGLLPGVSALGPASYLGYSIPKPEWNWKKFSEKIPFILSLLDPLKCTISYELFID